MENEEMINKFFELFKTWKPNDKGLIDIKNVKPIFDVARMINPNLVNNRIVNQNRIIEFPYTRKWYEKNMKGSFGMALKEYLVKKYPDKFKFGKSVFNVDSLFSNIYVAPDQTKSGEWHLVENTTFNRDDTTFLLHFSYSKNNGYQLCIPYKKPKGYSNIFYFTCDIDYTTKEKVEYSHLLQIIEYFTDRMTQIKQKEVDNLNAVRLMEQLENLVKGQ